MYQVVCVDDETFVLEDLKKAIDWFGFNMEIALAATNPLEALEYIQNHPAHLLLTDISMPQMLGTELIQKAREANPALFVLVLSAYDTFDYVRTAMQGGAENYLLKPLDPDELSESLSIIVKHLEDRHKMSENYGATMLTFRSNFVENWCKGSLSEEEFLSRASLLGVNYQLDNYTVVMFSTSDKYSGRVPLLFDALLSVFIGQYISHFYFETPSCFVCILSSTGSFNVFHFQRQVEKLRPIMDFPFFVSVGNTVDNYVDVSSSYHTVKKYFYLRYSPLDFLVCQNLQFPLSFRKITEQDYLETEETEYLDQIQELLNGITPERRISLQLTVANWGISQLGIAPSDELTVPLLGKLVCDKNETDKILECIRFLYRSVRQHLMEHSMQQGIAHQYVRMIMDSVHDFSNKDISLKTLAAQLNMHPSYLGNIFHQQTGYYFNDYLNEERLKYAAQLMEDNDVRLKDIADMAGFSSQTYFNRQFKKYFNASPNSYRRELKIKKPGD